MIGYLLKTTIINDNFSLTFYLNFFLLDDLGSKPTLQQQASTCFVASGNRTPSRSGSVLTKQEYRDVTSNAGFTPLAPYNGARDSYGMSPQLPPIAQVNNTFKSDVIYFIVLSYVSLKGTNVLWICYGRKLKVKLLRTLMNHNAT